MPSRDHQSTPAVVQQSDTRGTGKINMHHLFSALLQTSSKETFMSSNLKALLPSLTLSLAISFLGACYSTGKLDRTQEDNEPSPQQWSWN